jgi:hypothetical protein
MKTRHNAELAKAIAEAISQNEDKVWVYVGIGYILEIDNLTAVVAEAISEF